jgi:hypothetical protein
MSAEGEMWVSNNVSILGLMEYPLITLLQERLIILTKNGYLLKYNKKQKDTYIYALKNP